jgi:hypothetical protein
MTGWNHATPHPGTDEGPAFAWSAESGQARSDADPDPEPAAVEGSGSDHDTVDRSTGRHDPVAAADPGDWTDGTDPAGWSDADATGDPFPRALGLDVQPTDGGPWVDPALLGGPDAFAGDPSGPDLVLPSDPPEALRSDLAVADGDPDSSWDALQDSDDPAIRALAKHWTP